MNSGSPARAGMLLAIVLLACSGCTRGGQRELTLAGSTSIQPFAEKWADAYRVKRPTVAILVQGGGSTAGVRAALVGAAQIGMSSRALRPDEAAGLEAVLVARDGIAIVVHPGNPLSDLSLDQLRRIYAADVHDWRELGGKNRRVTVITREEGSGTRSAFEELVMGNRRIASSALVQDSNGAVRQMVASDAAAIGYVSLGLVDSSVKALRIQGIVPTEASIDAGTYPLVRPFLFLIAPRNHGATRDFIDWIAGEEGRALTRREGLLPAKHEL